MAQLKKSPHSHDDAGIVLVMYERQDRLEYGRNE